MNAQKTWTGREPGFLRAPRSCRGVGPGPRGARRTAPDGLTMPIYVDGDACPVKEETYRVARRHQVKVYVVSNSTLRVPREELIELVVVRGGFDAADDWIVEHIADGDVAITADIPLA